MSSHDSKTGSTTTLKEKLKVDEQQSQANEQQELPEEPLLENEDGQESELLDHPSYKELQKQLTQAEEKANQSWERMLRMQADMENTQRRVERDIANAHKFALEKFVSELLPVIDGLERAIAAHAEDDASQGSLLDGVQMTLKMFSTALEKFNVQQINPLGQPFNPEHHQAISTQEDPHQKPNTVLNVLQKGYLLNNRLIRPALVVVNKA